MIAASASKDIHSLRHYVTGYSSLMCSVEIHTGKIHMYFVTSVLYEITCITSNTDKPDTDSNPGVCMGVIFIWV